MTNLTYTTTILNDFLQGQWRTGASDTARLVVTRCSASAACSTWPRPRASIVTTPTSARRSADGACTAALTSCCRSSAPRPCAIRSACWPTNTPRRAPTSAIPGCVWPIFTVDLVDHRAHLLDLDKYIDQSFDPYAFVRNAWLQRREYQVHPDQTETPDELLQDPGAEDLPPTDTPPDKKPPANAPRTQAPPANPPRADAPPSGDAPTTP